MKTLLEIQVELIRIEVEKHHQRLKVLEGMQGPEQGLVGESRSDEPTGPAEEAKPGERGVGEIGGASELRRHLARKIEEARENVRIARENGVPNEMSAAITVHDALVDLRADFDRIAEKRSDLSNA